MPYRAGKKCARCNQPITGKRCLTCQGRRLDQLTARQPASSAPEYTSRSWRDLRKAKLAADPLCEMPAHRDLPEYRRPYAVLVDHIDGLGPDGPRGLEWANLASSCKSCHSKKTNRHDGGLGNPIRRK